MKDHLRHRLLMWARAPLQVDAFSRVPFGGNPAAVVLLSAEQAAGMTDRIRQLIAAEMNLAETAFLEPVS